MKLLNKISVLTIYVVTPLWFVYSAIPLLRLYFSSNNDNLQLQVIRIALVAFTAIPLGLRGWKYAKQTEDTKLSGFALAALIMLLATNSLENMNVVMLLRSFEGR